MEMARIRSRYLLDTTGLRTITETYSSLFLCYGSMFSKMGIFLMLFPSQRSRKIPLGLLIAVDPLKRRPTPFPVGMLVQSDPYQLSFASA